MMFAVIVFIFLAISACNAQVSCYTGTGFIPPIKKIYESLNFSTCDCIFYRFACSTDDYQGCTDEEIKTNTLVPVYTIVSKATSAQITHPDYSDIYLNARACSSNNCNAPSYYKMVH